MVEGKVGFIVSPIGEEGTEPRKLADEKYDLVYEPVLKELGYIPIRADKENTPNSISRGIVKRIIESELVIADVTGYNANVFYELAIRNAVKKPIIIVREKDQKLPFDIYDKRAISIDMSDNRQWIKAKDDLKNHIINAEKNPEESSESILTEFTFEISPVQKKDPEGNIILLIQDMKDEIHRLRKSQSENVEKISERIVYGKRTEEPSVSISTNKTVYKNGEQVLISVSYQNLNREIITIILTNPLGRKLLEKKFSVIGSGKIVKEIYKINEYSQIGAWIVEAKSNSDFSMDSFVVDIKKKLKKSK